MSGVTAALRDGILAAQARQFDRARELLQQVTTESPTDPVGWFWLAVASSSASDAIPCLRRVLELDSAHDQARSALTKLLQSEAHRLAASGARAEARVMAAEACELTPDAQALWLALAALTDDQKERLDALRRAVKIAPDDAALRTRLRQALLARGVMPSTDRVEARECFREAAQLNADDARVWQALAKLADTPAESVEALRQLRRIAPDTPNATSALRNALAADARSLAEANRVDDAYKRWREAIDLTGGDVELWLGIASTTTNQEESAKAVETAYKLNPSNSEAIAAMRKLQASKIDPAKVAAPVDAFSRFGADENAATLDGFTELDADASFTQLDASLDAFASLPDASVEVVEEVSASAPEIEVVVVPASEPAPESWDELEVEAAPAPVIDVAAPASAASVEEPAPAPPAESVAAPIVPAPAAPEPMAPAPVVAAPAAAVDVDTPAPVAASPSNGSSSRKTVMIVDDSPTIRKILGLTLERAGYKVVAEPDGESAIERLIQVVPHLILLDIAMPKIDGYEVCKRIKQDPRTKHVPVVMLSGKGALFDKVKGHMAGATEYLTKPFETPAVLAVVTNYCEQPAEVVNG